MTEKQQATTSMKVYKILVPKVVTHAYYVKASTLNEAKANLEQELNGGARDNVMLAEEIAFQIQATEPRVWEVEELTPSEEKRIDVYYFSPELEGIYEDDEEDEGDEIYPEYIPEDYLR